MRYLDEDMPDYPQDLWEDDDYPTYGLDPEAEMQ